VIVRVQRLTCLLIGTAALLSCAGCARREGPGPVEIVYWTGWSGHELDTLGKLVAEFNRTHPHIRVRMLTQFNNTGSYQKARIAFAGGATPEVMSTVWDKELAAYALRGVLTPLDDYLKASGRDLEREFTPGIARMVRVNGKVWGLTITTNSSVIVYNKKIFREVGLDPERPPRTIAEFDRAVELCTKFDSQGKFVRYGFRPQNLRLWAYVFGGRWYDPASARITANDPRNVAALRWLAGFRKYDLRKMAAFGSGFGSAESANGPFYVGQMAMWATGEWSAEFIRRYAPNLEWGWFAMPAPPRGRPNTTGAGGSVFVIPEACRHKEEAWEFVNWISSPYAVKSFCRAIRNVPPLKEAGRDPEFQKDPFFRFAIELSNSPHSFGPPTTPIWPTYDRELQRVEEAALLGGKDPKALLDDLQRRMEREQARTMAELGG
jgi:multiple sugar transport system substrate-binding protein